MAQVGLERGLLVARVERLAGLPRLVVVRLAQRLGTRVVSQSYPGLPGIREGGRYVFMRVEAPLGFLSGLASSSTGTIPAQVGTVVANWTMTVDLTFQPIKNGAIGTGRQAGVTTLTFNAQVPATPGAGLTVTCTNNGGAPDTIGISLGGMVAPGLYHPDITNETHQPPTFGTYMVRPGETQERALISMTDRANS